MFKFTLRTALPATTLCLCCTLPASNAKGDEEHGHVDALLTVGPDGRIYTGGYAFDESEVENVNTRIYEAEFDEFFTTDEPGFNAVGNAQAGQLPAGYSQLPGNTAVGFTGRSFSVDGVDGNLFHWDGSGAVNFDPVADGTVLRATKIGPAPAVFDGTASDVAGFTIETTDSEGFLHKHIDFTLDGPGSDNPADGFFAWALTIEAGTLSSEPTYFIHGAGDHEEAEHELAVAYFEANVVPEPASALLLAPLGALALRRRRA